MIEVLDSENTGVDAFGVSAVEAANLCKRWTGAAA